jgi:hypothetical protein
MGQGPGIISTRQPEIHAQAQSHRPHCIAGHVLEADDARQFG